MKLRLLTWLTAWVIFMQMICYAQPSDPHRLQAMLLEKQAKKDCYKDTAYIDALNEMAHTSFSTSADSLFLYANKALACAKKAGYTRGEATALRQLGNGYRLLGDYTNTLSYYLQSLAVAERISNYGLMGKACVNIAMEYVDMHKNEDAMAMAARAKHYFEAVSDSTFINTCLIVSGEVWLNRKQTDSAMHYFRLAYQVAENMNNEYMLISTNDEIASALIMKGRYKEALSIYLRAMEYYNQTNDQTRVAMSATDVAWSYLKLRQYRQVLKYGHISLRISSGLKAIPRMLDVCSLLADAYKGLGDYRNALYYQSRFIRLSDSLSNEKMQRNAARVEARYEYEKKEARLRAEEAKKDIRHQAIVKEKELEIAFSALAIVSLSLLALALYQGRAARQKTNLWLAAMNNEIIRQKEEIEQQSYQLLLNNQQKDKLFSIISHDLKMPLYSLNAVLDMIKTQALSETELNRMVEELRQEIDHSSELVGNLLFWSNSQLNGIVANPVILNIEQLVSEVLELFKKRASEKGVALRNRLNPVLQGYADKDMIHVVIRNLVSNAIKFCRAGDTISIGGSASGACIDICVADTGTGIEEDILDKINRKKLVTTYGTSGEKGTGIGILLCREFIEINHGCFRVESKWGEGSRFCISLPLVENKVKE